MRLGDLLRTTRKDAGVKLRALARELGISHSYLVAIEQNKKPASDKVFSALIESLGIKRKLADYYRAKLKSDAAVMLDTDPAFVALVNQLSELGPASRRKVALYIESDIL